MRQVNRSTHVTGLSLGSSLVAIATAFAVAGCSGGGSSGGGGGSASVVAPATSGSVNHGTLSGLEVQPPGDLMVDDAMGEGFQIIVDGQYQDAAGKAVFRDITRKVTYTVDDPMVAQISGDGLITPVGSGVATITIEIDSPTGKLGATKQVSVVGASGTAPNYQSLAIFPPHRVLADVEPVAGKEELQQLVVVATDDTGRMWDLTRKVAINVQDAPNKADISLKATVSPSGLLRGFDNGTVYAVARVDGAALVNGSEFVLGTGVSKPVDPNSLYSGAPLAGSSHPVDQAVLANLFKQFIEPAKLSTDGEFLRRLYADALGRAPTVAEVEAFEANAAADKREQEIDAVLASADFAAHWAQIMGEWFEMPRGANGTAFDAWAETEIAAGTPLTDMVAAIARGDVASYDAVHDNAAKKVDVLVQAGAGMSAKCAVCHDHPLVGPNDTIKWTQADRYPLDAFFATAQGEAVPLLKDGTRANLPPYEPGFVFDASATVTSTLADPVAQRRAEFATLFAGSDALARGLGHRIFAEVTTPLLNPNQFLQANLDAVTVPNVLDAITATFKADSSLKGFLKGMFTSKYYQLSTAADDTSNDPLLARRFLRRHHAEVVDSALDVLTGATLAGGDLDFLNQTFGYPFERLTIAERVDAVNMSQSLVIMNSPIVQGRIADAANQPAQLAGDVTAGTITVDEAITTLFKAALSRPPTADELTDAKDAVTQATDTAEGLEDVAAALAASIEFSMRN